MEYIREVLAASALFPLTPAMERLKLVVVLEKSLEDQGQEPSALRDFLGPRWSEPSLEEAVWPPGCGLSHDSTF